MNEANDQRAPTRATIVRRAEKRLVNACSTYELVLVLIERMKQDNGIEFVPRVERARLLYGFLGDASQ